MCGRYGLGKAPDKLLERLESMLLVDAPLVARYNIAPTQPVLAVLNDERRTARQLRWGLIPPWSDGPGEIKLATFNARIETIATAASYRGPFRSKRCVIPADGFFEWRMNADGKKTPIWIFRKDQEPFCFAGLWDVWRPRGNAGDEITSCTIITQPASEFMTPIHSRMPCVLNGAAARAWLAPGQVSPEQLFELLEPREDASWSAYPVATAVGNVRNQGAELRAPADSGAR